MWKKVLLFSLARSELWKLVNFRTFCAKKLSKDFICFNCRIKEVHFSELVKGICHLSAARRQIGRKTAVFWSVKNWIWSGKSPWKVREFCFCMRVATLIYVATVYMSCLGLTSCWTRTSNRGCWNLTYLLVCMLLLCTRAVLVWHLVGQPQTMAVGSQHIS